MGVLWRITWVPSGAKGVRLKSKAPLMCASGQVFASKVGSEAGPGGEMAIIDGFDPCGGDRVPTGSV